MTGMTGRIVARSAETSMIGNDVVDLGDPETRAWVRHPRFDARVFSDSERALIAASADADRMRWVLWAAKESAYKVARKEEPRTVFAPSRFVVSLDRDGRATVHVDARRFDVDVVAGGDHVHAVARSAGMVPDEGCVAVAAIGSDVQLDRATSSRDSVPAGAWLPGAAARCLAIVTLARLAGVAPQDLAIHRDGRIPMLYFHGRRSQADLSLSHHGRFVAFACAVPSHWRLR